MLSHSRGGTGEKEKADINSLLNENLGFVFHSFRAKYGAFKVDIEKKYNENLKQINIVKQDISRVVVNIVNNAFDALHEKCQKEPGFQPKLTVQTSQIGPHLEIRIKDNGPGIPDHIVDKVFNPFFTIKPAGKGTGLGLSLSHDIITSHNGQLKVSSHEGQGTEFVIVL